MTRVFSTVCLTLLLVAGVASSAFAKTKIAVLGLEVTSNNGGKIDEDVTRVAKDLTTQLRKRISGGTTTFELVQDGEKELIDEKVMANCEKEDQGCMSTIAQGLHADVLLYGKLEKLPGSKGYQLYLNLLRLNGKSLKTGGTVINPREAKADGLAKIARDQFASITGEKVDGWLIIKTNIDRGTVLLDDKEMKSLSSGTARIDGVPEGRYTLAIEPAESSKWARYEEKISISAGKPTEKEIEIKALTQVDCDPKVSLDCGGTIDGGSKSSNKGVWKGVMWGGIVVGAASGAFTLYNYKKFKDLEKPPCDDTCRADGDKHANLATIGLIGVGIGGTAAIIGLVKAYIIDSDTESSTQTGLRGRRQRRSKFAVTPIIVPDGGGATVRIDW